MVSISPLTIVRIRCASRWGALLTFAPSTFTIAARVTFSSHFFPVRGNDILFRFCLASVLICPMLVCEYPFFLRSFLLFILLGCWSCQHFHLCFFRFFDNNGSAVSWFSGRKKTMTHGSEENKKHDCHNNNCWFYICIQAIEY